MGSVGLSVGLVLLLLLGSAVLPPSQPASAEVGVLATVNVSSFPESVAVDPVTNRIFVVNTGSGVGTGSVSVLDGRTHAQLGAINITSGNPYGVAIYAAGRKAFVSNTGTDTVSIINIDQGAFGALDAATLGAVATQGGIAVNNTAQQVYFAVPSLSRVTIYNASTNAFITNVTVEANPEQIAINETTGKAYVTSTSSNNISILGAGPTYTVTSLNGAAPQQDVAVNPDTNMVYVTLPGSHRLLRWDDDNPATATLYLAEFSGSAPYGVAVNPVTKKVYISRSAAGQNSISVYDERADTFGSPIPVGTGPRGIAINSNSGFIYVANRNSATVSVLGVPHLTETVLAGAGADSATDVAVNPVTNRVYTAFSDGSGQGGLAILDGSTLQSVAGSPITINNYPVAVAVNTILNRVYVVQFSGTAVVVISGATNAILGSIELGADSRARGVVVDSERHLVYVVRTSPSGLTVIDGQAGAFGAVSTTITAGIGSTPSQVAYNPSSRRAYVYDSNSDSIAVVNTMTNTPVGSPIAIGDAVFGLSVNPATGRLYVAKWLTNTVAVYDVVGDANALVATVAVRRGPSGIEANPATNRIFVVNNDSSNISTIDGATNMVVGAPIVTAQEPIQLALNPHTNRTYVTTGDSVAGVQMLGPTFSSNVSLTLTPGPAQVTFGALFGAHASDKIGLFPSGAASNASPIASVFTNGTGSGAPVSQGAVTLPIPSNQVAGSYEIRFVSGHGAQTLASLKFRVQANPIATNDSAYTVAAGNPLNVPVGTGLLANDTDIDNPESLTAQVVTPPASGTLNLQANGAFTYTPASNVNGPVTFTYKAVDGDGLESSPATVTITLTGQRPVAVNDAYATPQGVALTVNAPGVLANDTDPDTAAASLQVAEIVSSPQSGSLTLSATGKVEYTPDANFAGTVSFQYRTKDPQGLLSTPATVTITVVAPVACTPRPPVTVTTSVVNSALQAVVTVTSTGAPTNNLLQSITFGTLQNAQVTLNGAAMSSGQAVTAPANTTSVTLIVRRATPGQATTVPFTVVDACGSWPSFVGGGPAAGF